MNEYPVRYTDGTQTRVAYTPSDEVQLAFDGFVPGETEATPEPPAEGPGHFGKYRELQEQAKELNIPANQSAAELDAAIDAALEGDRGEGE